MSNGEFLRTAVDVTAGDWLNGVARRGGPNRCARGVPSQCRRSPRVVEDTRNPDEAIIGIPGARAGPLAS
jgi:hypothetical protein